MIGEDNSFQLKNYAVSRGELELAQGQPDAAESMLRKTILQEESEAKGAGRENIAYARRDRDLYAALAGVWPPGETGRRHPGSMGAIQVAHPWRPHPCLSRRSARLPGTAGTTRSRSRIRHPDGDLLVGQIVLRDRLLLYRATPDGVIWRQIPSKRSDLLSSSAALAGHERTLDVAGRC